MRKRVIVIGVCALALLAIGSSPRMVEELQIGGGYGDSADGGLDVDKEGNVATDGDVVVEGELTVPQIGVSEDADLVELSSEALTVNGTLDVSGLTTLSSDLLVDGGEIGTTADADLVTLHNGYVTVTGFLEATIALVAGIEDTQAGQLTVFGNDSEEGGRIIFNPGADYDTNTGRWDIGVPEDTEDWCLRADESNVVMIDGTTQDVTVLTDLFVDGGNIGLTSDADLLSLASDALTVNGTVDVDNPNGLDVDDALRVYVHGNQYIGYLSMQNPSAAQHDGDSFLYISSKKATGSNGNQIVKLFGPVSASTSGDSEFQILEPGGYGVKFAVDAPTGNTDIAGDLDVDGDVTLGDGSTDTVTCTGRFLVRQVNDDNMDATAGTEGEIVYNQDDDKFYGCTATGDPATWAALH